jgi:hypothetical protein
MMKKIITLSLVIIFLLLQAEAFSSPQKIALVIGNSNYKDAPLHNPVNDADEMASALQKLGFSVIKITNATQQEMEDGIRHFGKRLTTGDIALFFYSGHGVQVNGLNYLIPIDARIYSEDEIKYQAVEAGMVLDKAENAGSGVNIIILDACRSNPFKGFRSASDGLAPMLAPKGSYIAYATAPGTIAYDGTETNSPYTKYLLRNINIPGLKLEEVFKNVRSEVVAETMNKQVPWDSSSLIGDFYFVPLTETDSIISTNSPSQMISRTESSSIGNWAVILGSYPKEEFNKADARLDYLKILNYEVSLIDSDDYPKLKNGLWVVIMGPYSKNEAQSMKEQLKDVILDCYIKKIQ